MNIVEEQDGVTSLIAAVESGRGVAFVPSCVACMAGPRLKVLPLVSPAKLITVGAFRREGAKSAAVQKFIAAAADNGKTHDGAKPA